MPEWRETTLGDLVADSGGAIQTGPFGSQLHASDYVATGTPIVMPTNIGENFILEDGIARVSDADADRLARHRLTAGDIVYSRRGDVERRALVRPENEGWLCGTGCLRVHFGSHVSTVPEFVSYALGTEWTREWITKHAVGATMLNLNTTILNAVPLRVPDSAAQIAIAEVLGALDDKIAANTRTAAAADKLACAVFASLARDARTSDKTFDDLALVRGGGTPSSKVAEYWNGDISWASPTDITALPAPYLTSTSRHITDAGLSNCASALYPTGSILMTSRATIGAFALTKAPVAVNQGFIVVVPPDVTMRYWLFHEMRSRVPEFLDYANGATFLELSRGNFRKLPVRLADDSVMTRFALQARDLHDLAAAVTLENERLAATRDALLPALMSGKLRIKDAERVVSHAV